MADMTKEEQCKLTCAWKGGSPCLADDCPRRHRTSNERVSDARLEHLIRIAEMDCRKTSILLKDGGYSEGNIPAAQLRALTELRERRAVETTGAPDVNDMFRAGVTQAKYRRYYYEALLRVLNSDRMLSHDIARAAVDGSPEHLPEEPEARREYHANGTYWSGVPTIDMPCDFCTRPITDHDPRTHACPPEKTSAKVVPSVCGKPMPNGKGAGQCINVPGHEGECDDMPL